MTVEGAHTFSVGPSGIVAHNKDCDEIAGAIEDAIGGETKRFEIPPGVNVLGPYRPGGQIVEELWDYHKVVVKDGLVYDEFVWGMPIDEWKSLWDYADAIDFGF